MPSYGTNLEPIFNKYTDTHNNTTNKQSTITSAFPSTNKTEDVISRYRYVGIFRIGAYEGIELL